MAGEKVGGWIVLVAGRWMGICQPECGWEKNLGQPESGDGGGMERGKRREIQQDQESLQACVAENHFWISATGLYRFTVQAAKTPSGGWLRLTREPGRARGKGETGIDIKLL